MLGSINLLFSFCKYSENLRPTKLIKNIIVLIFIAFFEFITIGALVPFLVNQSGGSTFLSPLNNITSSQVGQAIVILFFFTLRAIYLIWATFFINSAVYTFRTDIQRAVTNAVCGSGCGLLKRHSSSELMTVFRDDVHQTNVGLYAPILGIAGELISLIAITILYLILNGFGIVPLTLLLLAPTLIFASRMIGARVSRFGAERIDIERQLFGHFRSMIEGKREIDAAGWGPPLYEKSLPIFENYRKILYRGLSLSQIPRIFLETGFVVMVIAALFFLGASNDSADAGLFLISSGIYAVRVIPIASKLAMFSNALRFGESAAKRLLRVLNYKPVTDDLVYVSLDINLVNSEMGLVLTLPPRAQKLRPNEDRSILVAPDFWTRISGPSGSGKSTFLDSLAERLKSMPKEFPQDSDHSHGDGPTVILLGTKPYFSDTDFEHSFLPDPSDMGFRVLLDQYIPDLRQDWYEGFGSSGVDQLLSLGQLQRLSLIRAVLLRPKFLLIDEGLSGVEPEFEEAIFKYISIDLPETCLFYVSHRESSIYDVYFKNEIFLKQE